jgi:hypothetical protein
MSGQGAPLPAAPTVAPSRAALTAGPWLEGLKAGPWLVGLTAAPSEEAQRAALALRVRREVRLRPHDLCPGLAPKLAPRSRRDRGPM